MSFLVTRPPVPVPGTTAGSTPCSAAIRATTGDTNVLPFPDGAGARVTSRTGMDALTGDWGVASGGGPCGVTGGCSGAISAGGVAVVTDSGSGRGSGSGSGGDEPTGSETADPAGAMVASTVPTSTVSPSATRIW